MIATAEPHLEKLLEKTRNVNKQRLLDTRPPPSPAPPAPPPPHRKQNVMEGQTDGHENSIHPHITVYGEYDNWCVKIPTQIWSTMHLQKVVEFHQIVPKILSKNKINNNQEA